MGEGENGAETPAEVPNGESVYVVQRLCAAAGPTVELHGAPRSWEDISTVTVPSKSRRRPTLQKALDEEGIKAKAGDVFRLLDERSAEEIPVNSETRLVVG